MKKEKLVSVSDMYKPTIYDFPEDFPNENGFYEHTCWDKNCGRNFIGNKGRRYCKVCTRNMSLEEKPEPPIGTAKYMYKCRLCGAQFFDGTESSAEKGARIMSDIAIFGKDMSNNKEIYGENAVQGMTVSNIRTHHCYGEWGKNMAIGLADLIGCVMEEK